MFIHTYEHWVEINTLGLSGSLLPKQYLQEKASPFLSKLHNKYIVSKIIDQLS
jgi:hypothetical protein